MYLVVFRNRKRADIDAAAYAADDGEVIALSEWASEQAALDWRRQAEHARVQGRGRTAYYESYTLFAGTPSRVHHFPKADT